MRKSKALIFFGVLVCTLISGCQPEEPSPFRVGLLVWPPYELFYLAENLGYYQGTGIEIVDYRTPSEAIRAYQNGQLDAVALTNHLFLRLYQDDPDQRIVFLINESAGADALIAKPEFSATSMLKGKRVGAESSALGAYVLLRALESGGLSPEEIVHVPVDISNQFEAFKSDQFDAVITYEPFRTQMLNAGGTEIFSSLEIPGEISDVLVSNKTVVAKKGRQIRQLFDGWFRAVNHFRENREESARQIAHREGLSAQDFLAALDGIHIFDLKDNKRLFHGSSPPYLETLRHVSDKMQQMNLTTAPNNLSAALETSFVEAAGQ